ncbi:MAG TPA: rhomboid family intramembrane serine protease [Bacteroidales bacterium]|nr:rhomboid family intramembrane serine protease [Bacteroidales bacterium]HPF02636.1 rhomboid family intramembrane serine protease [Bacteroidales bacterium]HPR11393.1 rhomboid family intramembrane serine protease [Bacteroidales bacterium]
MNGYGRGFFSMTPVVKNIIMINILMFLATAIGARTFGVDLNRLLGLYFPKSDSFMPLQIVTHMFMHANFMHILFNMYAVYIFGQALENVWGPKRFLLYYFVTGLGAAFVHLTVIAFEYDKLARMLTPEQVKMVINEGASYWKESKLFTDEAMKSLQILLNTVTVGASGAVFGVLLAFGILFPNTQLMIIFPPIPIRAKYFVIFYGVLELFLAFSQPGSNIAHFAHLGGMLFGWLLIKYWNKTKKTLY